MGNLVRAACVFLGLAFYGTERIEELRRLDFGDWPLSEGRKQVCLDPPQHRLGMPRSPLAALIGVPLARQDLECVLGAYPPIALFLLSQLSGVCANRISLRAS